MLQSDGGLFVSQQKYDEDLLKKYGMLNCRWFTTPMNANEKLSLEDSWGKTNPVRYRKVVGSLLYLTHTKSDLVYAVGIVLRFMQSPSIYHFGVVKRILHYVAGTMSHGLMYTNTEELKLCGFTDSDWRFNRWSKKHVEMVLLSWLSSYCMEFQEAINHISFKYRGRIYLSYLCCLWGCVASEIIIIFWCEIYWTNCDLLWQ